MTEQGRVKYNYIRVTFGRAGQRRLARRKPIHGGLGWHLGNRSMRCSNSSIHGVACQQQLPYFNRLAIDKWYPSLIGPIEHIIIVSEEAG